MRKWWLIPFIVFGAVVALKILDIQRSSAQFSDTPSDAVQLTVGSEVVIDNTYRIGINLGQWTTWGTQQYMRNVLQNPGFEGRVDRHVVIVSQAGQNTFSDESGQGRDDNYWNGGAFDVRTGPNAGFRGVISSSKKAGAGGFPQFFSSQAMPTLSPKDVVIVSKETNTNPIDIWWVTDATAALADNTQKRPGSTGMQSLKLTPISGKTAEVSFYLDHITARSGKMLPVNGPWKFSIWAKAQGQGAALQVSFARMNGSAPFFSQQIIPTADWKEYPIDFTGTDTGPDNVLKLVIRGEGNGSQIWIDDVFLGPVQNSPLNFRKEVVDVIKEIRPSFIRDYGHLTDSLDNRLADWFGRKTFTIQLQGGTPSREFSFALTDLVDLCFAVGANPWIIVPTTFSDEEYRKLGEYLASSAGKNKFSEVVLEFGNENWNWVFRPMAIPYYEPHGKTADRAFEYISLGAGTAVNMRKVVNGQHVVPWVSMQFLDNSQKADGIVTAPYFLFSLAAGLSDEEALTLLFQDDTGEIQETGNEAKARNKSFAVYEINMHTAQGNAPPEERNRVVSGAASGSALGKRLLDCLLAGANPVIVYNLSQHDSRTWDIPSDVNLWGVTRTFGPPARMRPTGLALIMLNKVIGGKMHSISPLNANDQSGKLTMAAFKKSDMWTAALVSSNNAPVQVELQFPGDGHPLPASYLVMQAATPFDTNEILEEVQVVQKNLERSGNTVRFTIPAYGMVVLGMTAGPASSTSGTTTTPPTTTTTPPPTTTTPPSTSTGTSGSTQTPPSTTSPTSSPTSPPQTTTGTTTSTPSSTPQGETLDQLRQRVRELEQKQEEMLRDLQELINILGVYSGP